MKKEKSTFQKIKPPNQAPKQFQFMIIFDGLVEALSNIYVFTGWWVRWINSFSIFRIDERFHRFVYNLNMEPKILAVIAFCKRWGIVPYKFFKITPFIDKLLRLNIGLYLLLLPFGNFYGKPYVPFFVPQQTAHYYGVTWLYDDVMYYWRLLYSWFWDLFSVPNMVTLWQYYIDEANGIASTLLVIDLCFRLPLAALDYALSVVVIFSESIPAWPYYIYMTFFHYIPALILCVPDLMMSVLDLVMSVPAILESLAEFLVNLPYDISDYFLRLDYKSLYESLYRISYSIGLNIWRFIAWTMWFVADQLPYMQHIGHGPWDPK